MSSSRQIIPVAFDQSTSRRVVVVGDTLADPDSKQQMVLCYGTKLLFQATIYTAVPTVYFNPDPAATYLFGIDDVPFSDDPDCVVSQNSMINVSGDWSALNPASGLMSIRADLDGALLKTRLKAKTSAINVLVPMWAIFWMMTAAGNVPIACWQLYIRTTPVDPTTAKPVQGVTHLTTTAAAASYVPRWGDQARWRWNGSGWEYLFSDGWCEMIPDLVNGQRIIGWGSPKAI